MGKITVEQAKKQLDDGTHYLFRALVKSTGKQFATFERTYETEDTDDGGIALAFTPAVAMDHLAHAKMSTAFALAYRLRCHDDFDSLPEAVKIIISAQLVCFTSAGLWDRDSFLETYEEKLKDAVPFAAAALLKAHHRAGGE